MEKEIVVNGSKIAYFDEGEGFPILMIHGWGPWLSYPPYAKLRKLLVSQGYRVIFLCLPGFGKSSVPSSRWGMDEYLECISDFIEQMNLKEFFLVGHSMGGAMSVRLAVSQPQKIKALILLAPGVFRPLRFLSVNFKSLHPITIGFFGYLMVVRIGERFLSLASTIIENFCLSTVKLIRPKKVKNRPEEKFKKVFKKINRRLDGFWKPQRQFFFQKNKLMAKILKNIAGLENTLPYLSKVRQPTLVIWGENDSILLGLCGCFMGRIPNYEFKIIPGVGHNLQEEVPEKVVELMVNFLKKLDN